MKQTRARCDCTLCLPQHSLQKALALQIQRPLCIVRGYAPNVDFWFYCSTYQYYYRISYNSQRI